jgi:hypothetical protein
MLRVLLFRAGKTILHRNQIYEVTETHTQLRQLMPLVDKNLSEAKPYLFWVPLRPAARKQMKAERIRRQYTSGLRVVFSGLHYTGEARPIKETVPLKDICREIESETHRFLRSLGSPESRLSITSSRMTQLMSLCVRSHNLKGMLHQQLNKKKKEFMENLVVEHLRRSHMNDEHISACYDVLVGDVALSAVAKQRGLYENHLRQVVNRVVRKVRPAMEAQLSAWAGEDEIQRAVSEIKVLETQRKIFLTQTPAEIATEKIICLR